MALTYCAAPCNLLCAPGSAERGDGRAGRRCTQWKLANQLKEGQGHFLKKLLRCCGCVLWEWPSLDRRSATVTEYDLSAAPWSCPRQRPWPLDEGAVSLPAHTT